TPPSLFPAQGSTNYWVNKTYTTSDSLGYNATVHSTPQVRITTLTSSVLTNAASGGPGTKITANLFSDANLTVEFRSFKLRTNPSETTTGAKAVWYGKVLVPDPVTPSVLYDSPNMAWFAF